MATVKPFCAIRPREDLVQDIAALPYDVYSRKEAYELMKGNNLSFLRIDRPETQFPEDFDMYSDEAYAKASSMLWEMVQNNQFVQDEKECYYIYALTMDGRTQVGIVACASVDDYQNQVIKKHENTRAEKEKDRIRHVDTCNAQTGPIFLAYRKHPVIAKITKEEMETAPVYDFTADDGIRHEVWIINDSASVDAIKNAFDEIDSIYIADGHHRCASAVRVSMMRREANPNYTGEEEYNSFLSVLFPDEELMIMSYNRVLKSLGDFTMDSFLETLSKMFTITESNQPVAPESKGIIGMYLGDKWYKLVIPEAMKKEDPVEGLDVSILQNEVLTPLLGIEDPKTDTRIDFVGGIRGLAELERRCNVDCVCAFSMYATDIHELFDVADAGLLMPPKSTWFEPKLRSGLFIHSIK